MQLLFNKSISERLGAGNILRLRGLRDFRKTGDQQDQLGVLQGTLIDAEVIEQRKLCNIPPDIPYDSRGGSKVSVKDTEIIEVPEQKVLLTGC